MMSMFQLENQYRLFDYGININDVIQLMVRATLPEKNSPKKVVVTKKKEKSPTPSCSTATSSVSDEVNILSLLNRRFNLFILNFF